MPYCLGAAWSRGELSGRRTGWTLLLGGAAATAALVLWAGYPATMVGVPGVAVSNLDPPTLAVVTFGLAQCGAALLLMGPLRRALRRPALWAVVATLNLSAMTVFLWHQTAMIAVTATGLWVGGTLPGLHTVPDQPGWVLARLAWLPHVRRGAADLPTGVSRLRTAAADADEEPGRPRGTPRPAGGGAACPGPVLEPPARRGQA